MKKICDYTRCNFIKCTLLSLSIPLTLVPCRISFASRYLRRSRSPIKSTARECEPLLSKHAITGFNFLKDSYISFIVGRSCNYKIYNSTIARHARINLLPIFIDTFVLLIRSWIILILLKIRKNNYGNDWN